MIYKLQPSARNSRSQYLKMMMKMIVMSMMTLSTEAPLAMLSIEAKLESVQLNFSFGEELYY